jgi:hypothetical protein
VDNAVVEELDEVGFIFAIHRTTNRISVFVVAIDFVRVDSLKLNFLARA